MVIICIGSRHSSISDKYTFLILILHGGEGSGSTLYGGAPPPPPVGGHGSKQSAS